MQRFLLGFAALAGLTMAAVPAQAGHHNHCCEPCCEPCCAPCVCYVDQVVTCYRQEWREKEVTYTVNKIVPKVVVTPYTYTVMVPTWTPKVVTCTVYKSVPRVVEQHITSCRMVPVTCTDPCSGCCYTCCKPETYVQTVQCTVYDCVPVQHSYAVNVCSYHPEQRHGECRKVVCECVPQVMVCKQRYCVTVPYQTVVKVAVCTPCCATACCH